MIIRLIGLNVVIHVLHITTDIFVQVMERIASGSLNLLILVFIVLIFPFMDKECKITGRSAYEMIIGTSGNLSIHYRLKVMMISTLHLTPLTLQLKTKGYWHFPKVLWRNEYKCCLISCFTCCLDSPKYVSCFKVLYTKKIYLVSCQPSSDIIFSMLAFVLVH